MNPYTSVNFFDFFWVLFKRMISFFQGESLFLVSDEIQLLTLLFLSLGLTLVGVFLVQAKITMLANALSHTLLLGVVMSFFIQRLWTSYDPLEPLSVQQLFFSSLISAAITVFFVEVITQMGVQKEASTGLVFTLFFAIGVIVVSCFARNAHIGTELLMGSVDGLIKENIFQSFQIFLVTLVLIVLFFKQLQIAIFDPDSAKLQGLRPQLFRYGLFFQTAWIATVSFQAVGLIMPLAFIVAPALACRRFNHTLPQLLFFSSVFSICICCIGVAFSRHLYNVTRIGFSTGALIVVLLFFSVLLFFLLPARGKKRVGLFSWMSRLMSR